MSRTCGRRGCGRLCPGRDYYCSWQHRNEEWILREQERNERRKAERAQARADQAPPTCRREGCAAPRAEGRQLCERHGRAQDRARSGQVPEHRLHFHGADLVVSCAACGLTERLGRATSTAAARAARRAAREWACEHECEEAPAHAS